MFVVCATRRQRNAQAQDPQSSRQAVQSNRHWQVHASSRVSQSPPGSQKPEIEAAPENQGRCRSHRRGACGPDDALRLSGGLLSKQSLI